MWIRQKRDVYKRQALGVMLLIFCVLPAGMSRSAWISAAVSGAWVYGIHVSWGSKLKEIRKRYKRKVLLACIAGGIIFTAVSYTHLDVYKRQPTIVKLFDNKLFIVDMFDEGKIVKIYDLEKKEILLSFAKKGEGPYEYLHVNNIDIYRNSDSRVKISLFDPVSSKLGVYDYDSLLIIDVYKRQPLYRFHSCR